MTDTSFVRTYGNKAIAASSFYDQDNMGFYLNPDSISRTNRIDFSHAYDIDDGNYYLDPSWASRFNYLGRNYGFNWTEYDWNDTSYYVDPNNTSSFNSVRAHTFLYHSDRRLKKNIVPVSHSLDKITSLTGYTFDWIRDGTPDIGIIAQEVERVFPDIVHTDTKTGMKSVKYGNLVAPIIEAIKEIATNQNKQDKKIQELQDEINELRKIIKK